MLPERRVAELVLLDVEDGAQILADALALLDAHCVLRPFDAPRVPAVDDDPQNGSDRLAPQLDVEDLQPVAGGDPLGGRANTLGVLTRRKLFLKKKKWAWAHSRVFLEAFHPPI